MPKAIIKKYCLTQIIILSILFASAGENNNNKIFSPDSVDYFTGLNNYIEKSINEKHYLNEAVSIIELILANHEIDNDDVKILREFQTIFSKNDLNNLIYLDSILKIDVIPPRLIKALGNYLKTNYINIDRFVPYTYDCIYPAQDKYEQNWNTTHPNPYARDFAELDTLINIRLVNDSLDFHTPGEGRVSSRYGWRNGRFHSGIDLAVYHGLPIYASFHGVVRIARSYGGYGRIVVIRHDNGLETYYAHLSRISVKPGERVKPGDMIGRSGNSGRSFGTHLHFEIRYKGIPMNPAHLICFKSGNLRYEDVILKRSDLNYFVYTEDAVLYKVQRGDYLYRIAKEFGTTISKICETNDIRRSSMLSVGQVLKIYP